MSLRYDIEQFLYLEARLLDEDRLEEWLALFTDDATYSLPTEAGATDPNHTVSLVYDDVDRLRERIRRLRGEFAHAQEPPSRVCRSLSNIEVSDPAGGELDVHAVMLVVEARIGRQNLYGARCRYRLRDADGWRIAHKQLVLVNSDQVIDNLTVIL